MFFEISKYNIKYYTKSQIASLEKCVSFTAHKNSQLLITFPFSALNHFSSISPGICLYGLALGFAFSHWRAVPFTNALSNKSAVRFPKFFLKI